MGRFELSAVIDGHTNDVRCLAEFGFGLVSGSRDATARVWTADGSAWTFQKLLRGHPNFVSSVCFRKPRLVYTGCNDGKIRVFDLDVGVDPVDVLEGHTACVSKLFVSSDGNTVISSSWDATAKVWSDRTMVMELKGHEAAVWAAISLENTGVMVTASADTTIKLWRSNGTCARTLKVHTQAVRDLSVAGHDRFVSCGNDGLILLWHVVNPALETEVVFRYQDSDFVYSVSSTSPATAWTGWISCGENTGLKVFEDSRVQQEISVPAISVWSVCILGNGDIAAGCSDNKIYVFSRDEGRVASLEAIGSFDAEIRAFKQPDELPDEIGGVKTSDIPGPEALEKPGTRDGQTKMVRDGGVVSVHSWSSADSCWTKIGDVVGEPTKKPSKVTFEGEEYDHVFHIGVDEGVVLKLPYNSDEEPYVAAQAFIHKHNLPQDYLELVARFIIKNSGNAAGTVPPPPPPQIQAAAEPRPSAFFPLKTCLDFPKVPNVEGLTRKLREFNAVVAPASRLQEDQLDQLIRLASSPSAAAASPTDAPLLMKVLRWREVQFNPGLDIARLFVLKQNVASAELADSLVGFIADASNATNQMLALKVLANLFSGSKGRELMTSYSQVVFQHVSALLPTDNKNAQVAVSTLLLNYAVVAATSSEGGGSSELQEKCLTLISLLLDGLTDPEAKFRTLVALGTLMDKSAENRAAAASLDIKERVRTSKMIDGAEKVVKVSDSVLNLF